MKKGCLIAILDLSPTLSCSAPPKRSGKSRSLFLNILLYIQPEVKVIGSTKDSVTINIITTKDPVGLFFKATVLMQESDRSFSTPVPNAEKSYPFDRKSKEVTITGLDPGRRFLIRLDPVDSVGAPYSDKSLKTIFEVKPSNFFVVLIFLICFLTSFRANFYSRCFLCL